LKTAIGKKKKKKKKKPTAQKHTPFRQGYFSTLRICSFPNILVFFFFRRMEISSFFVAKKTNVRIMDPRAPPGAGRSTQGIKNQANIFLFFLSSSRFVFVRLFQFVFCGSRWVVRFLLVFVWSLWFFLCCPVVVT